MQAYQKKYVHSYLNETIRIKKQIHLPCTKKTQPKEKKDKQKILIISYFIIIKPLSEFRSLFLCQVGIRIIPNKLEDGGLKCSFLFLQYLPFSVLKKKASSYV